MVSIQISFIDFKYSLTVKVLSSFIETIGSVLTSNVCVLLYNEFDLPLKMVVISVLSLNVYLLRFNIVVAMNKTFGVILFVLQNSLIKSGLIFLEIDFKVPSSKFPFKLGVKTVESISWDSLSWKNFLDDSYFSLFSFSFSIRLLM